MDLKNAINHARLAKAINAQDRDIPANAALVILLAEVERLKEALEEIAGVAECSEGVEFYAMLARKALEKCDG